MITAKRVFFVNRFYWPDEPATAQLLTDLAEALVLMGWAVTVVTSQSKEETAVQESRNGVHIVRVPSTRKKGAGLISKLRQIVSFWREAPKLIGALTKSGDILVMMTDPPLLGAWVTKSAKRRGIAVIHWVQDIYPEVAMSVTKSSWLLRWLRPARDAAWRQADGCVVPGNDMAAFLRSRDVNSSRITLLPNWAPAGLSPNSGDAGSSLRGEWGLDGKFVVAYSGNLGRVHDLIPIIHLARALRDSPEFIFLFIGSGAQRKAIESLSSDLQLTNVQFRPAQPREKLAASLSVGDVHLVTLRSDCVRWVFPSKLYGITAVGRPVLFIGPPESEIATLLSHHGFGAAFRQDELPAMTTMLRTLRDQPVRAQTMAAAALRFHEQHGGPTPAVAVWNALLQRLKPLADRVSSEQTSPTP